MGTVKKDAFVPSWDKMKLLMQKEKLVYRIEQIALLTDFHQNVYLKGI